MRRVRTFARSHAYSSQDSPDVVWAGVVVVPVGCCWLVGWATLVVGLVAVGVSEATGVVVGWVVVGA